jgi:hypothetical protein
MRCSSGECGNPQFLVTANVTFGRYFLRDARGLMHTSVSEKNAVILLKISEPSHKTQRPGTCAFLHMATAFTSSTKKHLPVSITDNKSVITPKRCDVRFSATSSAYGT